MTNGGQHTQGGSAAAVQGQGTTEEAQDRQGCKQGADHILIGGHDAAQNFLEVRGSVRSAGVEHGQGQQEANQRSGVDHAVIVQLVDQLAVLFERFVHLAAEEQGSETSDDEAADNGEVEPDLQNDGNDGQDQGDQRGIGLGVLRGSLGSPGVALLADLQVDAGQHGDNHDADDQRIDAPVRGVPAEGELRHLIRSADEGAQLRELQDGVQVHTSGDRTHEAEHGDCLGDAQGHQDGQDDNADGDNGAGAHHGGEDEGSHNVQQNDGDDGTVAAQLNSLTDQGGGDAGLHQDAAKPGAPADVDQRGAPAFRGGLVDLVQDRNQRSAGVTAELQDGVLCNKCGRCDQSAQQRKDSPDDGDDQEADHQVVTFYAVVGQAEKGQDEDNANHKFHKKIPPSHGSRLQRCVSAM